MADDLHPEDRIAPRSSGRAVSVPRHRAWRAARLGGVATRVAGNMAAQRAGAFLRGERPELRDLLLTPANIARITGELARMRGAAMKLGQLVSMDSGDILPPELAQILSRLRADADFMPPAQLKAVLTEAWGRDWLKQFRSFDVRPIAAASIGQVHRAVLRNGEVVAIKVQYPGVAQSIDSDVANVAMLVKLSGLLPEGFAIDPYVEEARKQLHEETDYLKEAQHLERFRELLAAQDRYELPGLHRNLTTKNVLTMSFITSQPLEAVVDRDPGTRGRITQDLIDLVLAELFSFGVVQTDPNFANFRFNPDSGKLVLLDFGASRVISGPVRASYRDLIQAGLVGDGDGAARAAQDLGLWDAATSPAHIAQLREMMDLVFEALGQDDDVFDFADHTLTRALNARGMALAESGFVPPPVSMDVLFIQRKLAGVFLIASNLAAQVPLRAAISRWLALQGA